MEQRILRDYAMPNLDIVRGGINLLSINTNNLEIKPLQAFYNGLNRNLCSSLDRAFTEAFMSKAYAEACQLIEDMVMNFYMWSAKQFTYRAKQSVVNAVGSWEWTPNQGNQNLNPLKPNASYQHPFLFRAPQDQERKLAYGSDPLLLIRVSKLKEGLHVVQVDMHQIHGQLDQVLQLLQKKTLTSSISSNTELNLKRERKEHATEVPFRSGVVVKEPIRSNCRENEVSEKDDNTRTPSVGDGDRTVPPPPPTPPPSPKPIPFPSHLEEKKKKESEEFLQFLHMFKAMNLNLPFLELIEKISNYVKFLRDVMSHRKKIGKGKKIALNKECNAIVSRRVPPKLKDLDTFTIPMEISGVTFKKALCDVGAFLRQSPCRMYQK
ncbi:hypothetical protein V6Z12_A13G129700 [Gossypium hirsutum]